MADAHRLLTLKGRVLRALQARVRFLQEKREKHGKADVFTAIKLKLNVFRALAMHTLKRENAKLALKARRSLTLRVQSRTAVKVAVAVGHKLRLSLS